MNIFIVIRKLVRMGFTDIKMARNFNNNSTIYSFQLKSYNMKLKIDTEGFYLTKNNELIYSKVKCNRILKYNEFLVEIKNIVRNEKIKNLLTKI